MSFSAEVGGLIIPKPGKASPVLKSVEGLLSQSLNDAPLSVVLYCYKCRTISSLMRSPFRNMYQ